jgi:hypothetical protein
MWYQAALDEMDSLIENGVFELVKLPPGRKAIGSRWVFKIKRDAAGLVERYKARLVAKGYSQRPGFDYSETFSPTPKWATIRAILAYAALNDLEIWSVDISSAFLNGELDDLVFMQEPEGFETSDRSWALRLRRSLYGLKQAGREWHKKLHGVLVGIGFTRVRCEHSVWVYGRDSDATRIIVPVFVDDMTITAKDSAAIRQVIKELETHFKLRDLGETQFLLGVKIERNREERSLSLSQRQYILDILERANMSDCNPVTTPLDPNITLSALMSPSTKEEREQMKNIPYINILGAIAYLAIATRLDLAYAISVLSRFSKNPGMAHWTALKRVLRYLKGTLDIKLRYAPDPTTDELFTSYSDADHGGNPDNGRSTSGIVIKMGTGAISWMSRLQSFVTISTTEAEFVAAVSAGQEILWLRHLFTELGLIINSPSTLHIDNMSALSVARNPEHHGRMKHLDLRFYWLRDEIEKGTIRVQHISTDKMPADALTKSLPRQKLIEMLPMLGLINTNI